MENHLHSKHIGDAGGGDVGYETAAQRLRHFTGIRLSRNTIRKITMEAGKPYAKGVVEFRVGGTEVQPKPHPNVSSPSLAPRKNGTNTSAERANTSPNAASNSATQNDLRQVFR